jgi:CheY-like chemotaxis protein
MNQSDSPTPLILVTDDEASIRAAVRDILEYVAIDTLLAGNGQEAVDLFTQHRHRIGAVMLDLRMPIMDGKEAYRRIRELDADIHIILSSGYDESIDSLRINEDPHVSFLRKPYAMDALLAQVQAALRS